MSENVKIILIFLIGMCTTLIPHGVFALSCAADREGWQGLVPNSGGLVYPSEIGFTAYNAGWIRDSEVYHSRLPVHIRSPAKREGTDNIANAHIVMPQPYSVEFFPLAYVLTVGDRGGEVKQLQRCLNALGFPVSFGGPGSLGKETVYFDKATEIALRRFQTYKGLSETGILDRETRFSLEFPFVATEEGENKRYFQNIQRVREIKQIRKRLNLIREILAHLQQIEVGPV